MSSEPDEITPMNLSLPTDLHSFVEQVSRERGIAPGEFVLELVHEERKRRARQAKLETLLLEGLESGPAIEVTPEFWERRRRELEERHRSRGNT